MSWSLGPSRKPCMKKSAQGVRPKKIKLLSDIYIELPFWERGSLEKGEF